jgi:hypothetical protein
LRIWTRTHVVAHNLVHYNLVHYNLTSKQLEYARAAEATWSSNARFGTGGARTSAGSGAFETALEQRLESELEPNVCCRASSSNPECRLGQTWLSTDQQTGRLLYMSTPQGRS